MHVRNFYLSLALLFGCIVSATAQVRRITGRVLDQKGDPVANASVAIKGGAAGTATDDQGQFSIVADRSATLVITAVGFAPANVSSDLNNPIIHLTSSSRSLDEVVVVAYGTQKRSEVTAAISTVSAATIKDQQITTVGQALQGTATGVLVVNSNGQPGENPDIRIRGIASILASAEPLIVVDGVVFNGNLNMINPNDIQTISIAKDATASALYGSRAANGVIIITTKSGRKNSEPAITLSGVYGLSSRAVPDYPYLNTQQHFELGWEGLRNVYADAGATNAEQLATNNLVKNGFHYNPYGPSFATPVGTDGKLQAGAVPLWNDDWTKALTNKNAARRDVNLGIGGGSEKSRYYFSAGYLNQESYIKKSNYERITTRFNYTTDLKDWVSIGANASITSSKQNYPTQGDGTYSDAIQYERELSSVFPIYEHDENGELIKDAFGNPVYDYGKPVPGRKVNVNRPVLQPSNLVATLALDDWNFKRLLTDLNVFGRINFTKNLFFKSTFGINRYSLDELHYENKDFGDAASVGGRVNRTQDLTTAWTWNNMLGYDQHFGEHHIDAMVSYEAYRNDFEDLYGSKTNFAFAGQEQPNNASTNESFGGYTSSSTLVSYLGRFKYDYASKYFAEVTVRNDASSIFAPGYRNGWFPAVGLSWLASEEAFLKNNKSVSLLKVRASYGALGNNDLFDLFPYLARFGTGFNQLTEPGVYLLNLANTSIQWERQLTTNVGVDFGFFNNRLTGSLDVFDKSSKKLLYQQPLPPSIGFSVYNTNIGKVQNRGVELNLDYNLVQGRRFNMDVLFNISYIENKIVSLLPGADTAAARRKFRRVVGKSIYEFYLPEWAGVDPTNGTPQWYTDELDGSGNPTGKRIKTGDYSEALNSQRWFGSGLPKVTGGLTTKLRYLGFDLNVLFNYAFGGKYYDGNYSNLMHGLFSGFGQQMHADELKRWQKPGDITNVPRMDPNDPDQNQQSTRFLYSGDYVRLRNVTLGYTFTLGANQKVFKNIRVYAMADNFLTWDKLPKGSDPESSLDGDASSFAFPLKSVSAGIDLTF